MKLGNNSIDNSFQKNKILQKKIAREHVSKT